MVAEISLLEVIDIPRLPVEWNIILPRVITEDSYGTSANEIVIFDLEYKQTIKHKICHLFVSVR